MSLNYSGFVNKTSHTVPRKIEFRRQRRGSSSEIVTVLVFLSRLLIEQGRCSLAPPGEVRLAHVPRNVQVELMNEKQMPEIRGVCPRTILPHPRMWTYRGGTKTERELERFFDRSFPGGADSIWQPCALQVRATDIEGPTEDMIVLQTDTTEVRIPITVSVSPDLLVRPARIALLPAAQATATVYLRNASLETLDVESLASDNPLLDLRTKRLSSWQVCIKVRWTGEQDPMQPVHATIRIKTNIGDVQVPYVLLASEGAQ